jgi:hypothetical protein
MNIVKKLSFGAASVAMMAPLAAFAQFASPSGTNLPTGTVTQILTNGMNWLLILVGILGVIGFVIAGILYLTAAGDEDQIAKAKKAMIYSIVGVIVALVGVVIIQAVQGLLGGTKNNF